MDKERLQGQLRLPSLEPSQSDDGLPGDLTIREHLNENI